MCIISDALEGVDNMSLKIQYTFSLAPLKISVSMKTKKKKLDILRNFAFELCNY
jgi:hypothetical protein